MRSILWELKMSTKIKLFTSRKKYNSQIIDDEDMPHLSKFFYVNLSLLHEAIVEFKDVKLDIQNIKDTFETVLYQNIHLFNQNKQKISQSKIDNLKRQETLSYHSNSKQLKKLKSTVSLLLEEGDHMVKSSK